MVQPRFEIGEFVRYGSKTYRVNDYNQARGGWAISYIYDLKDVTGTIRRGVKESSLTTASYSDKMVWQKTTRFNELAELKSATQAEEVQQEPLGQYLVISAHTKTKHNRTYLRSILAGVKYAVNLFDTNPANIDTYYVVEIKQVVHAPTEVVVKTPAVTHPWNGQC